MAENRDNILNDLIEYYDGETKANLSEVSKKLNEKNNAAGGEDEMGSTRIIPKTSSQEVPPEETFGDTVAVKLPKPVTKEPSKEASEISNTVRIKPAKTAPKTPVNRSAPVSEEVFGNLGLDGQPVSSVNEESKLHTAETDTKTPLLEEKPEIKKTRSRQPNRDPEEYMPLPQYDTDDSIWNMMKPLWITLIVAITAFGAFKFYITDTGIIGTYKRNFSYNISVILDMLGIDLDKHDAPPVVGEYVADELKLASGDEISTSGGVDTSAVTDADTDASVDIKQNYEAVEGGVETLPFDNAGSSAFSIYDNGVVCAKSNYLCYMNKNGDMIWETETPVTKPILNVAGKYIAVVSSGSTQVCVFEKDKLLFSIDSPHNIVSCDISERGDIALITEKAAYKGSVLVYNNKGEQIFSWSSGMNYITGVSMLKTRLLAVSLVNASNIVSSYVMVFDVKASDPLAGAELSGTLIYDVYNNGKSIFACGDNSIASLGLYGSVNYDMRFDNARLTHDVSDIRGNRLITYIQNNIPAIRVYNKSGDMEYDALLYSTPDCIDIYKSTVIYNNGREIICGKYSDDIKTTFTATMAIKKLILLDSRRYMIVYSNSLEFVTL